MANSRVCDRVSRFVHCLDQSIRIWLWLL